MANKVHRVMSEPQVACGMGTSCVFSAMSPLKFSWCFPHVCRPRGNSLLESGVVRLYISTKCDVVWFLLPLCEIVRINYGSKD